MKFKIKRASDYSCKKSPCECAIRVKHELVYKDAERECYDDEYEIEVTSLEDLIRLTKIHGDIIINGESLIIYDDYLE